MSPPTTRKPGRAPAKRTKTSTTVEQHAALVVPGNDGYTTFRCDCRIDFVGRTYEIAESRWQRHVESMRRKAGERP